jgi:hypothetical protein
VLRLAVGAQDMRISNIMEHRGNAPYVPKGYKDGDKKKKKKEKNERPVMLLRGALPGPRRICMARSGCGARAPVRAAGDSRPKELVFKIIDNGHARLLGASHKLPKAAMIEMIYRRCAAASVACACVIVSSLRPPAPHCKLAPVPASSARYSGKCSGCPDWV